MAKLINQNLCVIYLKTTQMKGLEKYWNLYIPRFFAVHDIINDGENGFIIPPKDEELYADKLYQLMNDAVMRETMMKNAVESSEQFSIETIGEQWIRLFEGLNQTQTNN